MESLSEEKPMTLSPSDLDRVEALAKAATSAQWNELCDYVGSFSYSKAEFLKEATPEFVLSLLDLERALQSALAETHDRMMNEAQLAFNAISDLAEARSQLSLAHARIGELEGAISEVGALIEESGGVYGLHLNGDLCPWPDILAGGKYEDWLVAFSRARAALASPDQKEDVSR
jgi:hypothetical protein